MAAALEARNLNLEYRIFEATEPFFTIVNFPRRKPIYTYPTDMKPDGDLQFKTDIKEDLIEELNAQTIGKGISPIITRVEKIEKRPEYFEVFVSGSDNIKALRVVVGIGRSGNFRKLGIPGEELDKVYNRLHDSYNFV